MSQVSLMILIGTHSGTGGSGKCCPITSPSDKCEYVSVIFRDSDHRPDALSREYLGTTTITIHSSAAVGALRMSIGSTGITPETVQFRTI